jgi:hypothetical protein
MSNFFFARTRTMAAMVASLMLMAACGGGGTAYDGVGSGGTGFISGDVTKGPVGSATVTAHAISGGLVGAQIGTTTTDVNGNFTISIGSYAGPVMLQVSGGSYTDEATGTSMAMASGDVMTAVMPTVAAGATTSGIHVTPVTSMAQTRAMSMTGGMTDANIAAANTATGNYFSVADILHTQPMNPLVTGSGATASQDSQNYGMTLAAMSQYAQTQGMSYSSAMITAMMSDASDGMMDGKAGSTPVEMGGMMGGSMMPSNAGTAGMGAAMNAFMSSARNKSGVTTPALVSKLNGATGQIMSAGSGMTSASVSGTAFDGQISKAMVTAFAVSGGAMGAQIASTATDGHGNFTLSLGSYTGPVMLKLSGGTYTDAATGTTMTMGTSDVMSAALPTVASGASVTGVWVTPVTSMAQIRATGMSGGMTDANIAAANVAMGNYFSVGDILHTQPMDPAVMGSGADATQDARNYGMTMAAMSQYAQSLGMANSSAMITAMTSDAFDGVMDGMHGSSQIPMPMGGMMGSGMMSAKVGTSALAAAMTAFANSAANASGMRSTDMAALIEKLATSDGHV